MSYFVQLADGLAHLHEKRVLHRDLKPENVLLCDRSTLKIGDFGISRVLSLSVSELAQTVVGSPTYISPEIIHGESYSYKTDVWSLGVMLYRISSNKFPFDASNLAQLALRITAGSFPPLSPKYSPLLHHLVASMLQIDPQARTDTKTINESPIVLEHRAKRAEFVRIGGAQQTRGQAPPVPRSLSGQRRRRRRPRPRWRRPHDRRRARSPRPPRGRAPPHPRPPPPHPGSPRLQPSPRRYTAPEQQRRGGGVASPAASTVRTSRIPLHRARRSGEQLFEQQPSPAAQQQPPYPS